MQTTDPPWLKINVLYLKKNYVYSSQYWGGGVGIRRVGIAGVGKRRG